MIEKGYWVHQMFCPECGKELPAGNDFCRFCGTELDYVKRFLQGNQPYTETASQNTGVGAEVDAGSGKEDSKEVAPGIDGEPYPGVVTETGTDTGSARDRAVVRVKEGDKHAATANDFFENAVRCYSAAIDLDPSCRGAWDRKIEALVRLGRTREAQICQENIPGLAKGIDEEPGSREIYIGGISSPSLKRGNSKGGLDIAGSIGANLGGYGLYVTDRRLFIVKNQEQVYGNPNGPRLGGFIKEELFGGIVATGAGAIDSSETIEIPKDEIIKIELKKPMMLSGFIAFSTLNEQNPRLFIDHKRVYDSIRVLMLKFCPERTRIIT